MFERPARSREAIQVLSDYSPAPQATAPPPAPSPPSARLVAPPHAPRERSQLGRLTASTVVLALGITGLLDLSGVAVSGGFYVAIPLAIIGVGLVIAAVYGRARWLIAPGIVLTLALGVVTLAEKVGDTNGSVTWRPVTVDQLDRTYAIDVGDAVLDLSALSFDGRRYSVSLDVGLGDLTVIVPGDVDVRVDARIDVGSASVLGTTWSGIGQPVRTVSDNGADGPGGGSLIIDATVDVGNLEVRR